MDLHPARRLDLSDARQSRPAGLSRRRFLGLAAGFAGTLGAGRAVARAAAMALPFQEIADGIHLRPGLQEEIGAANDGAIANLVFIVGDDAVAVFDSGTTRRQGAAVRAAVARVTARPIRYLIASHVHDDHCFGHAAFDGLDLMNIGHRNLPQALAARGPYYLKQLGTIDPALADAGYRPPTTLVADSLRLDLGNRPLILNAWPTAHTATDLTAFDTRTGTLLTGDLVFANRLPTLDGSLAGWLDLLPKLLDTAVARVVPGHGPVSDGRAAIAAETRYLSRLRDRVRAALADQLDIDATVDRLRDDNREGWLLFADNHERNVIAAYTELEWE